MLPILAPNGRGKKEGVVLFSEAAACFELRTTHDRRQGCGGGADECADPRAEEGEGRAGTVEDNGSWRPENLCAWKCSEKWDCRGRPLC